MKSGTFKKLNLNTISRCIFAIFQKLEIKLLNNIRMVKGDDLKLLIQFKTANA